MEKIAGNIETVAEVIRRYGLDQTTYQISDALSIGRRTVSRILKGHGVRIRRHKRAYSSFYEQRLSDVQKELLVGSLLGDGNINQHHVGENSCRYSETHGIKQFDYLRYKREMLANFFSTGIRIKDNTESKTYGDKPTCCFESVLHREFVPFWTQFYPDGKTKIAPIVKLTPFSLAVWYQDDGSAASDRPGTKPKARFHTEGFDPQSIANCQQMLFDGFGIGSYVVRSKGYDIVCLNCGNTEKLFGIVKDYIVPCMTYKLCSYNPVETCSPAERSARSAMVGC